MPSRKNELTLIGDLFGDPLTNQQPTTPAKPKRKAQEVTKATLELIETGQLIFDEPATKENAAFMHVVLCHLGMPRSPRRERYFDRYYVTPHFHGAVAMEAGRLWNGKQFVEYPLPYGVKPRHIFMNVITTAIRTKDRFVKVGNTRREYMLKLGIDPQGSEYRSFNKQVFSLAACKMQMGFTYNNGRVLNIPLIKPIETFEAWLVPDGSTQQTLWPGVMELSEKFYDGLAGALVPIDERAALALDGALELDIYFWLSQRLCRVRDPRGQFITWKALKDQFGQDYKNTADFKTEFIKSLAQALTVYPHARVEWDAAATGGATLYTSKPPIPKILIPVHRP